MYYCRKKFKKIFSTITTSTIRNNIQILHFFMPWCLFNSVFSTINIIFNVIKMTMKRFAFNFSDSLQKKIFYTFKRKKFSLNTFFLAPFIKASSFMKIVISIISTKKSMRNFRLQKESSSKSIVYVVKKWTHDVKSFVKPFYWS